MTGVRLQALVAGLLLVGAAVVVGLTFRMTTSITHFLPPGAETQGRIVESLADSELTRTVVLTLSARTPDRARRAARVVAERLEGQPEVAWVRSGVDQATQRAVRDLYFPHRLGFVSDQPRTRIPERLGDEGLRDAAATLKRRLASAAGALVRPLAARDPLLVFPAILDRLDRMRAGDLHTVDGVLTTPDGERAVVLLSSRHSPFDAPASRALLAEIDAAFGAARAEVGSDVKRAMSSVHRFAVHTEHTVRTDIVRVSVLSTLVVLVLFLGVFRSARALVLVLVPVGAGVLVALAATLLAFGQVHGLTLAFGSTLIGVSVDYGVHLLGHHALGPAGGTPDATRRRVWPAVRLGAWTTVAGFAGLAWTDFPGIREMAFFASAGVLGALGATRFVLPAFMGPGGGAPRVQCRVAEGLARGFDWLAAHRGVAVAALVAAAALGAVGIPRIRWVDEPRALQQADPALLAEDEGVRAEVGRTEAGRLVAALGDDTEAALRVNDRVGRALAEARSAGEVASFRSLHQALWSARLQRANLVALRSEPDLRARFARAFEAEGFVPGAFDPFFEDLAHAPPPLGFEALAGSALGDAVKPFRMRVGDRVALLSFLGPVHDVRALRRRVEAIDGALFVEQSRLLADAYGRFRTRSMELMGVGLLFVLALVWVRFRRLREAMAAFVPAVVAAVAALGVVGLLGQPANLLHAIACLLVLSIGVDYGVFVVSHHREAGELGATLMAVVIASLTTVGSFGLLAMSANPALRAVGTTTGVGVLFALLLAPSALALAMRRGGR